MLRLLAQLVSARDENQSRLTVLIDYAVATSIAIIALMVRFSTDRFFSPLGFPFICFFPAVLAAAFLTSLWPSIFCALLSVIFAWYFFIAPTKFFFPIANNDLFALCFFATVILIDCVVIHLMKRSMLRLKRAEHEMRDTKQRQDAFLAVMAHELRNPIQIIKSCVIVARRAPNVSEKKINIIEKQAVQMERIVSDLLDVARITTGKMHIEKLSVDLTIILQDVVEAFSSIAAQREQSIELDIQAPKLMINGDASRLTQVIENVLSNASKFSPQKSKIKVTAYVENYYAFISISDEGKGIPPHLIDKIFELNIQAEMADVQKGGLGIGLALSKYIINQHDGKISAFSKGSGQGSNFAVAIPLQNI